MTRPPPSSTLFPYTTLFRSEHGRRAHGEDATDQRRPRRREPPAHAGHTGADAPVAGQPAASRSRSATRAVRVRSEEHTSELQSPDHLVCRLLLEKKKKTKT